MNDPKLGIELIKKWEGLHLDAYLDPVGVPTIGWGTTVYPDGKPVKMGDSITYAEAEDYLYYDIKTKREPAIKDLVNVELDNYEFGALVSFIYNVGVGAFRRSTMLRKINQRDFKGASAEFPRWNKAGGKVLRGLVNRRRDERALWDKGSNAV
jgi:lysozyme